jgi:Leucine-rich repeat (LRR) protein
MDTVKRFILLVCGLALFLVLCSKNSDSGGTGGPTPLAPTSNYTTDTSAARAILSQNSISNISTGNDTFFTYEAVNGTNRIVAVHLDQKGLTTIPKEIGQLSAMRSLYVQSNQSLTSLPPEIGQCTSLTYIDISGCSLTALPSEIGNLRHLLTLLASHNALSSLPQTLWSLTELTRLELDHNSLDAIPSQVSNLQKLKRLWLNNNNLQTLPATLRTCGAMESVGLDSNKICSVASLEDTLASWLSTMAPGWNATQIGCP